MRGGRVRVRMRGGRVRMRGERGEGERWEWSALGVRE